MGKKKTPFSGQSVNSQITDAITQTNALIVGIAPAQSMATLYQSMSQTTGAAMQNAVANQQNMYSLNLASLTQNLQAMMATGSAVRARSIHAANSNQQSRINSELMALITDLVGYQMHQRSQSNTDTGTQTAPTAQAAPAGR